MTVRTMETAVGLILAFKLSAFGRVLAAETHPLATDEDESLALPGLASQRTPA